MLMAEAGGGWRRIEYGCAPCGQDQQGNRGSSNGVARALTHAWGGGVRRRRSTNRHVAFTPRGAAGVIATSSPGCGDGDAVRLYQGISGPISRGAVGATLFTFRTFPASHRFPLEPASPQQALVLGAVRVRWHKWDARRDDMDDIIDTIGQN